MENKEVDDLLRKLFEPDSSLTGLFNNRLEQLDISKRAALDIIGIPYRTLNGILEGTQRTLDYTNLIKLANFLNISKEEVFSLYTNQLNVNYSIESNNPDKVKFIKENFDLAALKKAGFINSISDYRDIEFKITRYFGFKSIFEYKRPSNKPAFSAGKVMPKDNLTRDLWNAATEDFFKELENPNDYDKQALIDYFPEIRWHSTNVEYGMINVIRELYKCGVSVAYQSSLSNLHLRGATLPINNKPCVVITDYKGFYPTLWFALIHELFHVLFDWEEIKNNRYHLSQKESDQLSIIQKEKEADDFAREYLFSKDKSNSVRAYLNDRDAIVKVASTHDVHPSFIYVFNAHDVGKNNRYYWAKAQQENPDITDLIKKLENPWNDPKPLREHVNDLRHKIYES